MALRNRITMMSLLGLCFACHKEAFRSGGDNVKAANKDLNFTCSASEQASNGTQTITGIGGMMVKVKGQFCHLDLKPEVQPLTVVFVTDFSASMVQADPGNGTTCDRLDAARVIVGKLKDSVAASKGLLPVSIGAISFDAQARTLSSGIKPMEQFNEVDASHPNDMTIANFCGKTGSGTNYKAAFDQVTALLAPVQGKKLVLFLSDGMPTYSSQEIDPVAQQDGSTAAQQLLANADVDLKIGFLNKNTSTVAAAKTYLNSLVRNADTDVKTASNAGELVTQFQSISIPQTVSLEKSVGAQGVIKTPGFGDRSVRIAITEAPNVPGVWDYETESFELKGPAKSSTINELTVTAKASDGSTPRSVIRINFSRDL